MIIPFLLAFAAASQQPVSATHLEVTPEGAFWITAPGTVPAGGSGGIAVQTAPRWEDNHAGQFWIGMSTSIGDNGAVVMAGKELNNEAASVYAAGSGTPLFSISQLGAEKVRVGTSARTPLGATLVHSSIGSGNYQAVLTAYDTSAGGGSLWTYTFPAGGGVIAGEVMISADGQRVVAVTGSNLTTLNMVRVFNAAGGVVSSFDLPAAAYLRQARLSADGSRLYMGLYNGTALIHDTTTGANLLTYNIGSSFDAHALAGDGMSFAYGDFGGLHVIRETSPGSWNQVAFMPVSGGGQYLGYCDLDEDGSHAAFEEQRYSPAYDLIKVGLFDVAANSVLWNKSHSAPGTSYQLVCSGVQISADAAQVVGCSWGDSLSATAEAFGYDMAGNQTMSLNTPGSVFALDLDADGDVVATGSKSVHANVGGNGGSIFCIEPYEPTLRLLGTPQLGGNLTLTTPGGATSARFAFCSQLGASSTAFGTTEVLLSSLLTSIGPVAIPPGGLTLNVNVPGNPAFAGRAIHVQGVRNSGGGTLTNKVSLRLVP